MSGPRRIAGTTRLAAVIGDPVDHSLSPALLNAAFAAEGLDWAFVALRVTRADLVAAVAGARAFGLAGLSVTTPHKSEVARLLDELAPSATSAGAVNCITAEGGHLVGHNTDGAGVLGAAAEIGFTADGGRALVLGAGGAARAAIVALTQSGAQVGVWARRAEAAEVASAAGGPLARAVPNPDPQGWDLVVNATSLGMSREDRSPLSRPFSPGQRALEMVYAVGETDFEAQARGSGCPTAGGASVLLHQAGAAFHLWTGRDAPLAEMRVAVSSAQESATMDR